MRLVQYFLYLLLLTVGFFLSTHGYAQEDNGGPTPPHPLNLKAGWWNYFKVSDEKLDLRVERALQLIEVQVKGTLNLDDTQSQHLEVYQENLRYILTARKELPQLPPLSKPIPAECVSCSINHYMELAGLIREQEAAIDSMSEEYSIRLATLERTEQHSDDLLVRYLSLRDEQATEKLSLGLEIMASRASLSTLRLKSRVQNQQIDDAEKRLALLRSKLYQTEDRLLVAPVDQDLLNAIKKAEREASRARERLVRNQLQTTTVQTGASELSYEVTYAIDDIYRSLHLLSLQVQQVLRESYGDFAVLSDRLPEWESQLRGLELQLEEWRQIARQRLQKMTSLADDELGPKRSQLMEAVVLLSEADKAKYSTEMLLGLVARRIQVEGGVLEAVRLFMSRVDEWFFVFYQETQQSLFKVGDVPITLWTIIRTLLIFVFAWYLSQTGQRAIARVAQARGGSQGSNLYVLGKLFHYTVLALAVIVAMSLTGIDFTNIALIGGALGIGIGFGLQGIVMNFISGLVVMFERNLKIGDYIEMEGIGIAKIVAINFQNILVRARDGQDTIIPNGELLKSKVTNWTLRDPFRRFHVPFSVAYGSDLELVKACVSEAADVAGEKIHDPNRPPKVYMQAFGDNGIEMELMIWASVYKWPGRRKVMTIYLEAIEKALRENQIEVPFPQRDIRIISQPTTKQKSQKKL